MDFHIPAFDDPDAFKGVLNAASEFYFRSLQELVKRLRAGLQDDEHLEILHHQTGKPISVQTVEYPGSQEIVLRGTTADGAKVHVFAHVAGLQLEVKVVRGDGPASMLREIGFEAWRQPGISAEDD